MNNTFIFSICFIYLLLASFTLNAQHEYVLATNNPFELVRSSNVASPVLGDIDNDGDLDLFVGQYTSNTMLFYRNVGSKKVAKYQEQTGMDNPLDTFFNNSGCNSPSLVDIDNDGDLDAFVGTWLHIIRYYINNGTASSPDFLPIYGNDNPLDEVATSGICSYPAFVDIDDDGDFDVFISDGDGNILFYLNEGDATQAVFTRDSLNNPLKDINFTDRVRLAFHDLNENGLFDVVIGHDEPMPELLYFENIGTSQNAKFEAKQGSENPFQGVTGDITIVPSFFDIDDDGDDDLIVGNLGKVKLYLAQKNSSNEDDVDDKYQFYPNPTSDLITIEGNEHFDLQIISNSGKVILTQMNVEDKIQINLSTFPQGLYHFKIISSSGSIIKKITLQ